MTCFLQLMRSDKETEAQQLIQSQTSNAAAFLLGHVMELDCGPTERIFLYKLIKGLALGGDQRALCFVEMLDYSLQDTLETEIEWLPLQEAIVAIKSLDCTFNFEKPKNHRITFGPAEHIFF